MDAVSCSFCFVLWHTRTSVPKTGDVKNTQMVRGGGGGLGSAGRNTTTTAAAASSSHAAMLTEDEITTEDFKQFVCSKAYDIITEGRYRKYLVRCKAASDEWALSAQRSVSLIQVRLFNHRFSIPFVFFLIFSSGFRRERSNR